MNTFFVSDLHFGHTNSLNFIRSDGNKLRTFETCDEMDETIIQNHNSLVKKNDKVYILGDVTINKKHLHKVERLNGTKYLILGNHDTAPMEWYMRYFTRISAYGTFDDYLLSHIPVHPMNIGRWKGNVHGHLHDDIVYDGHQPDYRYYNVGIDNDNLKFFPKAWEDLKKEMEYV